MTQLPPLPDKRGATGEGSWPDGSRRKFTIVDEIRRFQSDNPAKAFYLQKLKFEDNGEVQYRLGYYIIGKKPRTKGKWVWGQFAPMMPAEDFREIISLAEEKGWI